MRKCSRRAQGRGACRQTRVGGRRDERHAERGRENQRARAKTNEQTSFASGVRVNPNPTDLDPKDMLHREIFGPCLTIQPHDISKRRALVVRIVGIYQHATCAPPEIHALDCCCVPLLPASICDGRTVSLHPLKQRVSNHIGVG